MNYALVIAALLVSACGADVKEPKETQKAKAEHLSGDVKSLGTLSGTYYTRCRPTKEGSKAYEINKQVFGGSELTHNISQYIFLDARCEKLGSVTDFQGTYRIGGKSKVIPGFTELKSEVLTGQITFHDAALAAAFATKKMCGLSPRVGVRTPLPDECGALGTGAATLAFQNRDGKLTFGTDKINALYTKDVPYQIEEIH